jgi:hypothetical protein
MAVLIAAIARATWRWRHEIPPKTMSAFIIWLPKMAFITYKGEVPMSPYIIPKETKTKSFNMDSKCKIKKK